MTKKAQEAYMKGFCKAAEAYGVNPAALMKVAVPLSTLLETARQTGKVNNQLARALTNVSVAPRRLQRLLLDYPSLEKTWRRGKFRKPGELTLGKTIDSLKGKWDKGQERATYAVGNYFGRGKMPRITELTAEDPNSIAQQFWAQQLTHPSPFLPTGLSWNRGTYRGGMLPPSGISTRELRYDLIPFNHEWRKNLGLGYWL